MVNLHSQNKPWVLILLAIRNTVEEGSQLLFVELQALIQNGLTKKLSELDSVTIYQWGRSNSLLNWGYFFLT